jgi:hypothetical protein
LASKAAELPAIRSLQLSLYSRSESATLSIFRPNRLEYIEMTSWVSLFSLTSSCVRLGYLDARVHGVDAVDLLADLLLQLAVSVLQVHHCVKRGYVRSLS